MIRLNKSHLMIIFLSLVLVIQILQLVNSKVMDSTSVFKEQQQVCYLTFDDGPSYNTEKILDILKRYDVKATFFVIGDALIPERQEIIERIIEEGHCIGLHAYNHDYQKLYASKEHFLEDYETLYEKLSEDYGIEPTLFRFPGGSQCTCLNGHGKEYIKELQEKGLVCFDWNVSGEDAVGYPTVQSIQKNVLKRGLECNRAIVLLHDSAIADKTVEALPGIIEEFQKGGFLFDTLDNTESYVFPNSR